MRKQSSLKFMIFICILCIGAGFYISFTLTSSRKISKVDAFPVNSITPKKVVTDETIITELKRKQELIVMEADLSADLTVDASWGNWDVFKKLQNIHFVGKGLYTIDLSQISNENVAINDTTKTIALTVSKPSIKAVYVDEEKTLFQSTQNGLFRFGDMTFTPEELEFMISSAKKSMTERLKKEETYNEALLNTRISLKELIDTLLKSDKDLYQVIINISG